MTTNFFVRNVHEDVAHTPKQLAAGHCRSVDAEQGELLKSGTPRPNRLSLVDVLASMPNVGDDSDFDRNRASPS